MFWYFEQSDLGVERFQDDLPNGVLLVALVGVGIFLFGLDGVDGDDFHDLVVKVGHLASESVGAGVLLQVLRLQVLEPQDRAHLVPRRTPKKN